MAMGRRLLALAVPVGLLLSACGGGTSGPAESEPKARGPVELSLEEKLEAELDIPDQPDWMATGFGSVWVSRDEAAAVDRIDPETNEVVATIEVGGHPCAGMVAEFDAVWVPSCDEQAIFRIDPDTDKASSVLDIPVFLSTGALTAEISAGAGSLWMVTKGEGGDYDTLARIDPGKEEGVAAIPLGHLGSTVEATDEAVWVTSPDEGVVVRVDPVSEEVVAEIDGLDAPNFVAAGEEGVWVLSGFTSERTGGDGSIHRIDPETNEVVATVVIDADPGQAANITVGEGFVWVRTQYTLLAKVDPTSEEVVERYTDQKGIGDVVVDFGSVWLSDFAFNNVWRVPA